MQNVLIAVLFFASIPACTHEKQSPKLLSKDLTETTPLEKTDNEFWDLSDVDVSKIDTTRKLISFTFDDAPSKTLENIFAVFADFNERYPDCPASATVFFNGGRFHEHTPHLLHTALTLGFELGNHTHHHLDLTSLDEQTLRHEIDATDELLCQADGKPRHLLRAPYGKTNELVKSVADVPLLSWNIDTLDWTGADAQRIYESVTERLSDGAIVLMHDGYPQTVDALKRLLPDLYGQGYQVVSLSQLAKAHDCAMRKGGEYIRLRKQKKDG